MVNYGGQPRYDEPSPSFVPQPHAPTHQHRHAWYQTKPTRPSIISSPPKNKFNYLLIDAEFGFESKLGTSVLVFYRYVLGEFSNQY
jgi:hypothetical protein